MLPIMDKHECRFPNVVRRELADGTKYEACQTCKFRVWVNDPLEGAMPVLPSDTQVPDRLTPMSNPPAECVRCKSIACFLSKVFDPNRDEDRYQFRCLDCGALWWQDEHGGDPDEYAPRREW